MRIPATNPVFKFRGANLWVCASVGLLLGCANEEPTGTAAQLKAAAGARSEISADLTMGATSSAGQAVRSALLRHPAVQEAASEISASADEVRVSRAALFPQLGIGASTGSGLGGDDDEPALEVTGSQLITDFGATGLAIDEADMSVLRNYVAFQQAVSDATVETLGLMNDVIRYRQLVTLRAEQLDAMKALQSLVTQRRTAGATTEPDILETARRIQSAEFEVLEAKLAESEAQSAFMEITGQPFGGASLNPPGSARCSGGREASFEIQIARLDAAAAEVALERANRSHLPRIALESVARQPTDGGARVGMNVNIGTSLFEGGARSARKNAAANVLKARQSGVARANQSDQLEQLRLTRELSATSQRQQMIARQIELVDSARGLYRRQYFDLGTRDLVDLLDTEEDFFNLKADRINAQYDAIDLQWQCAHRSQSLMAHLGIMNSSLYGYPLGMSE